MLTDPWFYAAAIPAVIVLGLAKGGFSGLGMLAVPLMTLAVSPVQAASITLPILIAQDAVSVWVFRHKWDGRSLTLLIPAATLGILLGYLLAARVSSSAVELAVGVISIVFALQRLWIERKKMLPIPPTRAWFGVVCGTAAGFTSQIAHAGGPPFQIYMLPKRFDRDTYIGTSAIFFAAVNWIKVPAYAALGQFTRPNLTTAAVLLPLAVVSTVVGAMLVRRVSGERFQTIMYVLLIIVGAKLVWDGAGGLT
jgi:uncharacterized membrane protein YfcA